MSQIEKPQHPNASCERRLAGIRKEIAHSTELDPRLYNQWGDAAAQLGRVAEALGAYGRAIDAYIEAGQVRKAIAMCEKVIRNYPEVTRTHFTLCCLVLSLSLIPESVRALEAYTAAARSSRTEGAAIPRLRFFTGFVTEPAAREAIARSLAELGDVDGERAALAPRRAPPPGFPDERRTTVMLEAATTASERLWAKFWLP